jgi:hypothetical protein
MKSTNAFCVAAALCVVGFAAAPAIADTWTGAYNGTIVSTYADGRVVKVYVNPDHSYSITLPDGKILKGTWKDGDGGSCFYQSDPPPAADAKPACFPLKEYKVGDTFSGEDAGGKFTGVVQAGR